MSIILLSNYLSMLLGDEETVKKAIASVAAQEI